MSEPTGTAVAEVATEGVGALPQYMRDAINHRKQLNVVAGEMAKLTWGEKMDQQTRRAVADWAHRYGVDPATEMHVLGGNVYPNAKYYLRRLGELVRAGKVDYAAPDFIHYDTRLTMLAKDGDKWAGEELVRRQRERILHDVREEAIAACVFRIKLAGMPTEITGCKAIYGDKADPVGKGSPMETVETRAARRAIRMIASHVPDVVQEIVKMEADVEKVSARVESFRERQKAIGTEETTVHQIGSGTALKPGGGGSRLASQEHPPIDVSADEMREVRERREAAAARHPDVTVVEDDRTPEEIAEEMRLAAQ